MLSLAFLLNACAVRAQGGKAKPSDYGIKSKKALAYFEKGREMEKYRDYRGAIQQFIEAVNLEPEFADAHFRIGACFYVLEEYDKALKGLTLAQEYWQGPPPDMLNFYLAEVAFAENDFEKSYNAYKAFLDAKPKVHVNIIRSAEAHMKNAKFGKEAIKNPIKFSPENLGPAINTQYDEYLPYLTADERTIFFTSRRPGNIGGYNNEYRDFLEDFLYCELKDGEWQMAENLGPPVNTEGNEGAASFSPDGQYVYFTSCGRRGGFGDCDLYVSKLDGNKWSIPENLGPLVNTGGWESQPCISNDGRTLYFSSNRPGGQGGHDIWYSTFEKGRWTEAKNMGAVINTDGNEFCPFLHADGKTLYFSSNTHPGFGNLDLFMTKNIDGEWTEPENLGFPLNTTASEGNIFINAEGNMGYMNSNREDSKGKSDIYSFELDPKIRPEYTTYVRGFVVEKGTEKPLSARVVFINLETRDTIRSVQSNKATGKFLLTLPLDQDYAAFVDGVKGYVFASKNFSLKGLKKDQNNNYDLKIELAPIQQGETILLSNIFYETAKFDLKDRSKTELDHLIEFLRANKSVTIEISAHTDNVGSTQDNITLSNNRANEVRKYLLSKGVPEKMVVSKGYGESRPVADNGTEQGRALNRRTEFTILTYGK